MTCAFVPCAEAEGCALVGGCVTTRFAHVPKYERASDLKKGARMLTGVKLARANRDPALIQRKRKAL